MALKKIFFPSILIGCLLFVLFKNKNNNLVKREHSHDIELTTIKGLTMGTYYVVKYIDQTNPSISPNKIQDLIESDLDEINRQMSTYIKDSEISKFNQLKSQDTFIISPWFQEVLSFSIKLTKKTFGYFDPTVGPLVNIWGFGPNKSKEIPDHKKIKETLSFVGIDKLVLNKDKISKKHPKLYLDLSSIAKGFAVDQLSTHLLELGLENHLIEIGGELKAHGYRNNDKNESWIIGIEKPIEKRSVHELIKLHNLSIATSGDYRNFTSTDSGNLTHTINPKTGRAISTDLVSVSLLAESCMEADAIATALLVMGQKKALQFAKEQQLATMFITKTHEGALKTIITDSFKKWLVKKDS